MGFLPAMPQIKQSVTHGAVGNGPEMPPNEFIVLPQSQIDQLLLMNKQIYQGDAFYQAFAQEPQEKVVERVLSQGHQEMEEVCELFFDNLCLRRVCKPVPLTLIFNVNLALKLAKWWFSLFKLTFLEFYFTLELFIDHLKVLVEFENW